ncbi:M23 family metallopeptidase [Streptomyces sp. NPDC002004]
MPAKGKHRRPKSLRFTRRFAVAGTGGAALALPFLGATGAHAAAPGTVAPQAAPRTVVTAPQAAPAVYTVKAGDCLARIADVRHVVGGWQRLYADNRKAVGADPALIHPGLKLVVGAHATAPRPAAALKSAPKPASVPKSAPKPAAAESAVARAASKVADATDAAATTATGFVLPVTGATIGTPYHKAGAMWSSGYHTGVDFVVPTGTPLKAVGAGTVVSAGWGGAYGNQIVIRLADGMYAQYAHMSQLAVSAGQTVVAGQQLGLSGATGNVTGPHLHFEIRTTPNYGSDVDPLAYLRAHGVGV